MSGHLAATATASLMLLLLLGLAGLPTGLGAPPCDVPLACLP